MAHSCGGQVQVDCGQELQVEVVELRELAQDIAARLVSGFTGERLEQALAQVSGADGLIAVTPTFAGSYSGLFKSFFDVFEPTTLAGMPVLLAAPGGAARHSLMLDHAMRPLCLPACGADRDRYLRRYRPRRPHRAGSGSVDRCPRWAGPEFSRPALRQQLSTGRPVRLSRSV